MCVPSSAFNNQTGSSAAFASKFGGYGLAASAVGGIGSTISSIMAGASQRSSLRFQAAMNNINADSMRDASRGAIMQGDQQESAMKLQVGELKGQQIASMGASGVDMSTGSAQRTLATTDYMGQVDEKTIRMNAIMRANGYNTEATSFANQATVQKGEANAINPMLMGISSLATSAGRVAGDWSMLRMMGVGAGAGGAVGVGNSGTSGASLPVSFAPGIAGYNPMSSLYGNGTGD